MVSTVAIPSGWRSGAAGGREAVVAAARRRKGECASGSARVSYISSCVGHLG